MKLVVNIAPIDENGQIGAQTDECVALVFPTPPERTVEACNLGEAIFAAASRHKREGVTALDLTILIEDN